MVMMSVYVCITGHEGSWVWMMMSNNNGDDDDDDDDDHDLMMGSTWLFGILAQFQLEKDSSSDPEIIKRQKERENSLGNVLIVGSSRA